MIRSIFSIFFVVGLLLTSAAPSFSQGAAAPEAPGVQKEEPGADQPAAAAKRKARAGKDQAAPDASPKKNPAAAPADEEQAEALTPEEQKKQAHLEALRAEVELLSLERDKLIAENIIAKEKVAKELSEREGATERLEMEIEEGELAMKRASLEQRIKLERELAGLRDDKERLSLEAEIAKARVESEMNRLKLIQEESRTRLTQLDTEIQEKEKKMERNNYTEQTPVYLEEPLKGKELVVSDRRIALNGLISSGTADYISERINYFNNKDSNLPIFIIIDYSPGGSVMSGYKILKAMEGSQAPVYVVVKSFAASMAACITTLAERSFAYPNAVVLHHQLSGMSYGNLTRQKEFVEEAQEWWRRLAGPVAEKMGIGLEEFIEQMYANASTGDWVEFADKANELHWVDHIIEEVRETSLIKNPDAEAADEDENAPSTYHYDLEEQIDEDGRPFVSLPRLAPFDYYWLFNPDEYYRMR